MAKRADKKPMNAKTMNSDRRNGKAFKKNSGATQMRTEMHGIREEKRALNRRDNVEQMRNALGHIVKRIDGHDILVCDHKKGYVHRDLTKVD